MILKVSWCFILRYMHSNCSYYIPRQDDIPSLFPPRKRKRNRRENNQYLKIKCWLRLRFAMLKSTLTAVRGFRARNVYIFLIRQKEIKRKCWIGKKSESYIWHWSWIILRFFLVLIWRHLVIHSTVVNFVTIIVHFTMF